MHPLHMCWHQLSSCKPCLPVPTSKSAKFSPCFGKLVLMLIFAEIEWGTAKRGRRETELHMIDIAAEWLWHQRRRLSDFFFVPRRREMKIPLRPQSTKIQTDSMDPLPSLSRGLKSNRKTTHILETRGERSSISVELRIFRWRICSCTPDTRYQYKTLPSLISRPVPPSLPPN